MESKKLFSGSTLLDGFRFGAVSAEVKKIGAIRLDFALILTERPAIVAGVTTQNLVHAAPVKLTRRVISNGLCHAALVNSGNANAYTGEAGEQDAVQLVENLGRELSIDPGLIVPMSTGVIGVRLPVDRMAARIPDLTRSLSPAGFHDVAQAIMTTDTVPKTVQRTGVLSNGTFNIIGMCKGAGMIAPHMATMLAILMTDIRVDHGFLVSTFRRCCDASFNCVTIDGDTSTNDTAIVMSGGALDSRDLPDNPEDRHIFSSVLQDACICLAEQIVMDGEGATKIVEIRVVSAADDESAFRIARKIAESPLVKTAFHGEDPNWGRIICAAGNSGVTFDPASIDLLIGDTPVVVNGKLVGGDWEKRSHGAMQERRFSVTLDLKMASGRATMLTSDFSEEYVTINADYRS